MTDNISSANHVESAPLVSVEDGAASIQQRHSGEKQHREASLATLPIERKIRMYQPVKTIDIASGTKAGTLIATLDAASLTNTHMTAYCKLSSHMTGNIKCKLTIITNKGMSGSILIGLAPNLIAAPTFADLSDSTRHIFQLTEASEFEIDLFPISDASDGVAQNFIPIKDNVPGSKFFPYVYILCYSDIQTTYDNPLFASVHIASRFGDNTKFAHRGSKGLAAGDSSGGGNGDVTNPGTLDFAKLVPEGKYNLFTDGDLINPYSFKSSLIPRRLWHAARDTTLQRDVAQHDTHNEVVTEYGITSRDVSIGNPMFEGDTVEFHIPDGNKYHVMSKDGYATSKPIAHPHIEAGEWSELPEDAKVAGSVKVKHAPPTAPSETWLAPNLEAKYSYRYTSEPTDPTETGATARTLLVHTTQMSGVDTWSNGGHITTRSMGFHSTRSKLQQEHVVRDFASLTVTADGKIQGMFSEPVPVALGYVADLSVTTGETQENIASLPKKLNTNEVDKTRTVDVANTSTIVLDVSLEHDSILIADAKPLSVDPIANVNWDEEVLLPSGCRAVEISTRFIPAANQTVIADGTAFPTLLHNPDDETLFDILARWYDPTRVFALTISEKRFNEYVCTLIFHGPNKVAFINYSDPFVLCKFKLDQLKIISARDITDQSAFPQTTQNTHLVSRQSAAYGRVNRKQRFLLPGELRHEGLGGDVVSGGFDIVQAILAMFKQDDAQSSAMDLEKYKAEVAAKLQGLIGEQEMAQLLAQLDAQAAQQQRAHTNNLQSKGLASAAVQQQLNMSGGNNDEASRLAQSAEEFRQTRTLSSDARQVYNSMAPKIQRMLNKQGLGPRVRSTDPVQLPSYEESQAAHGNRFGVPPPIFSGTPLGTRIDMGDVGESTTDPPSATVRPVPSYEESQAAYGHRIGVPPPPVSSSAPSPATVRPSVSTPAPAIVRPTPSISTPAPATVRPNISISTPAQATARHSIEESSIVPPPAAARPDLSISTPAQATVRHSVSLGKPGGEPAPSVSEATQARRVAESNYINHLLDKASALPTRLSI